MTNETPAWAKNYKPRQNAPKPDAKPDSCPSCHANRLTSAEVLRLASLPAEQLETALMRSYGFNCKVDITNPNALKSLALGALAEIVETQPRNVSLVGAIRELIDRVEGKASQSISLDVRDDRMDKMPIDRLLRLAAMLDEPVVVLEPTISLLNQ